MGSLIIGIGMNLLRISPGWRSGQRSETARKVAGTHAAISIDRMTFQIVFSGYP